MCKAAATLPFPTPAPGSLIRSSAQVIKTPTWGLPSVTPQIQWNSFELSFKSTYLSPFPPPRPWSKPHHLLPGQLPQPLPCSRALLPPNPSPSCSPNGLFKDGHLTTPLRTYHAFVAPRCPEDKVQSQTQLCHPQWLPPDPFRPSDLVCLQVLALAVPSEGMLSSPRILPSSGSLPRVPLQQAGLDDFADTL